MENSDLNGWKPMCELRWELSYRNEVHECAKEHIASVRHKVSIHCSHGDEHLYCSISGRLDEVDTDS